MKKEEIERAASAKYPHPQIVDMQAAGHQGFVEGAEWANQEMIEKVYHTLEKVLSKEMLDKLVKVLEEEQNGSSQS